MDTRRLLVVALVTVAALGPAGVGTATAAEDCSFPLTRTDATAESVTIPADPETVVTLNPSAAQTMYEIGAWEEVVGVSTYADYLPAADEKTVVGTGRDDATVEQTLALDPDLVLAPNTISNTTVAQLRNGGLTVFRFEEAEDLEDIVEKTRLTGELVGACERADSRADELERQLDVIEAAVDDVERPRVFYTTFGFTAGDDTFVHEVIETAGGDNIAADDPGINANGASTSGYFSASASVVVNARPQWFVMNSDEYDEASVPSGPGGIYEGTPAYEAGNAVVLDANEISQPAPRIVEAILDLVQALHPEAYEREIEGRIDAGALDGERSTTAERLAGGSADLRAANVGRTDHIQFDLPPRSNATADVRRVNVTLATVNPTFELRLRYGADRAAPEGTRGLEAVRLSGNGIYADDIDHLTLRLTVNRSRLAAADPDTVTLYRANGTGWTPLQTTRLNVTATNASEDTLVYEARTTGLSTLLLATADASGPVSANATPTATATATAAPTATATPTPTAGVDPTDTPTPGSAPGFGPLAATAALATALAARRWRR